MIEVKNLKKQFGELSVLNGITEHISQGEKIAVIGPSGSGKSTFLRCLNLLEIPTEGEIWFDGVNMTDVNVDIDRMRQKMGMVFQHFNLFPHLTVLENIRLPLDLGKMAYDKDYEAEIITLLELEERLKFYPYQLSGGQQQRVAIARALITKPAIILADEPTGNLDKQSGDSIFEFMIKTNKNLHQTYVMVTHNLELANRTKRILTIDDGKIVDDKGLL